MLKSFSYDTDSFEPTPQNSSSFTLKTVSGTALCFNSNTEDVKILSFSGVKGSTKAIKIKAIEKRIQGLHGHEWTLLKVKDVHDVSRKGSIPIEAVYALIKYAD